MPKFLTGNELNLEIQRLFEYAENSIYIICPYIKLHDRFISTLKSKIDNPKVNIVILFGKNEDNISKSMQQSDLEFFKQFPNIEIRYEKNLHAKYYANEERAILTSMNLHSYSQDNNIEAGIMMNAISLIGNMINLVTNDSDIDTAAADYFNRVIEQSKLIFAKKPKYSESMLGLSKKYIESEVTEDRIADFFAPIDATIIKSSLTGYCIRTGRPIPFNINMPYTEEAYSLWKKFSNDNYPEKFCHCTGEPANGHTTKVKPVLAKNWHKIKKN
jgi:hypothetical protein